MANIDNSSKKNNQLEINVTPNAQYLKRKEFNSKKNPYEISLIQTKENKPKTDINIDLKVDISDEAKGLYEVVLSIKAKANLDEEELFNVELDYGGLFTISNNNDVDEDIREQILRIHCPTILFPYVRREISTESVEGGFAPLVLSNIDFASLYKRKKEDKETTTRSY